MRKFMAITAAALCTASALANVEITEIWAGGLSGTDATADWIELTNFGASAVSTTGWYYDDDSDDPTKNDPLSNISSIAPGESVIVLVSWEDNYLNTNDAVADFNLAWNANGELAGVQIGWIVGGSGLGGGGDAANIFDGNTAGALTIDREEYTVATQRESFVSNADGSWDPDFAQVGVLGAYESAVNASTGVAQPAVASPGRVVPEPASALLIGLGALALIRRR